MNVLVTVRLFCRNQLIAFSSVIISLVLNYIQSESYFSFSMSNQSFGCKAYVPARTYNVCVRMGVCVFKAAGCVQLMSFTYLCSLCIWWIHEWENPEIACELRTIFKAMKTFPENRNIYIFKTPSDYSYASNKYSRQSGIVRPIIRSKCGGKKHSVSKWVIRGVWQFNFVWLHICMLNPTQFLSCLLIAG